MPTKAPSRPRPKLTPEPSPSVTRTFTLLNPLGLHARPSALLINTLSQFACEVTVKCHGGWVSAKSILGIMSLAAGCHSQLTFKAIGQDAHKALAAVQELFETQFSEAYTPQEASPSKTSRR